jgi:hypothetical protein
MRIVGRACLVAVALGSLGSMSLGLGACGSVSVRYVVESDMRFEHCYRIDEDPRVSVGDKRACWTDWREKYQRGQDPNRIGYVAERLRVLDATTAKNGASSTPNVAAAATPVGCPPPNSPYAPPPPVATSGMTIGVNAPPPDVTCSDACNRDWKTCSPGCTGDVDCLGKCDGKLRVCMKACYSP